jgi:hypothetical protein
MFPSLICQLCQQYKDPANVKEKPLILSEVKENNIRITALRENKGT